MEKYYIKGGSVYMDGRFCDRTIAMEDGHIFVLPKDFEPGGDAQVYNASGCHVVPGFIDVHTHGAVGVDVNAASAEDLEKICQFMAGNGTTSWLCSVLTDTREQTLACIDAFNEHEKMDQQGAHLLGIHLEGPFLNPEGAGAQNPAFLRDPDLEEVLRLNRIFPVRKVSFAIELPGAVEFTAGLLEHGITPSCVHSAATYGEFLEGYEHGLRNLTHFCNQMTPLKHREIGLVGAGLLHEDVYLELICDTLHVCPDMIRLIFQTRDCDHLMLITDSVEASGMPEGEYELAGLPIVLKDGAVHVKGHPETLGGSVLTMNAAFRNVCEITGYPLKDLVKTTSWNQAHALGLERVGRIEPGYLADLTILSGDFEVERVFVNGEERYSAEE